MFHKFNVIQLVTNRYFQNIGAEKARDSLNGRFFGGRMVRSDIYDQALYECNDLSG